jgi:hypothetical protein
MFLQGKKDNTMEGRDIGVLMESHRNAAKRRAAGKPTWDRKVDITTIIQHDQDNESVECVVEKAHKIAKLLKACLPDDVFDMASEDYDWAFNDSVDALSALTVEEFSDGEFSAVEEFNGHLSVIYDWADINRVWLGK